jgi:hypothetical protein
MPDVFNARETAIGANLTDFFADVIFRLECDSILLRLAQPLLLIASARC